jgi:hypothetical protein
LAPRFTHPPIEPFSECDESQEQWQVISKYKVELRRRFNLDIHQPRIAEIIDACPASAETGILFLIDLGDRLFGKGNSGFLEDAVDVLIRAIEQNKSSALAKLVSQPREKVYTAAKIDALHPRRALTNCPFSVEWAQSMLDKDKGKEKPDNAAAQVVRNMVFSHPEWNLKIICHDDGTEQIQYTEEEFGSSYRKYGT